MMKPESSMNDAAKSRNDEPKLSRREMLKLTGIGGLGLLLGAGGIGGAMQIKDWIYGESKPAHVPEDAVAFYGEHQSGIVTPMQDFVCVGAFDMTATELGEVRELFKQWTAASARAAQGLAVGEESGNIHLPPTDTGEAEGLVASRLTMTFGVGPSFFDSRYGLASKRPQALVDLPRFGGGEELQPEWSGGDVIVQVCADDPQVAFHALRNVARIARGKAVLRWVQEGFQRTAASDPTGSTPRNLMGFKDGTANPDVKNASVGREVVWAQTGEGADWMAGGSYLVMRRIRMRLEVWDRSTLKDQEDTFGRHRATGAPLGKQGEFDSLEEDRRKDGSLVIPADAHAPLARMGGKVQIHRRGYSYSSGIDSKTGQLDAGLLFLCYNRDPRKQFIPMQQTLAAQDRLNEYIVHVGSGMYACFPGVKPGGYIGDTLL